MAWIWQLVAAALEIVWAIGLKYTDGLSRFWPTVGVVVAYNAGLIALSLAVKTLPVGTAYAVWVGIGIVGVVVAGAVLFGESLSPMRVGCIALITVGVLGLKLSL